MSTPVTICRVAAKKGVLLRQCEVETASVANNSACLAYPGRDHHHFEIERKVAP